MVGDEKGEDRLTAVSFAAGTAAFMACVERAVMVSVFAHWRLWAFLVLNLLLLAILFTSKSQAPLNQIGGEDEEKKRKKKKRRKCGMTSTNGGGETGCCVEHESKNGEDDDGKKEDYDQLSEEELNQRVEAFIARFRQHLVSDAKGVKVI